MTATLTKKCNKYYVIVSYKLNNKRKQTWVNTGLTVDGNNKRKAEKMKAEILSEWQKKICENSRDILFSDFMLEWLETVKHNIAISTYHDYKLTISNSINPFFAELGITLLDLKPYHIQQFYNKKIDDGLTANTVYHFHANIHKALKYAVKEEIINDNPADKVDLPKKEKHISDFYTAEELNTLLEKSKGTNFETVVFFAAWFGLRRGEILGIKWDCVDFDSKKLYIVGTIKDKGSVRYEPTAKTSSSIRSFPLNDTVSDYLKRLKRLQEERMKSMPNYNHDWDGFVCVRENGDLIPPDYISKRFPEFCERCGLKRIRFHELRHTNLSLLLDSGASMKDIQSWAGHSSYSTTANIYTHIQSKSKEKLSQMLDRIII